MDEIDGSSKAATLNAGGFSVTISPSAPYRDAVLGRVFFAGTVTVTSPLSQAPVLRTSIDCYLADLVRLREWLEAHVQELLVSPDCESPTWVSLELELQVTCLGGDVWHEEGRLAGDFTIRVLLMVGHAPDGSRVYAGFEGTVAVRAITHFARDLANLVARYEHID